MEILIQADQVTLTLPLSSNIITTLIWMLAMQHILEAEDCNAFAIGLITSADGVKIIAVDLKDRYAETTTTRMSNSGHGRESVTWAESCENSELVVVN